jgi:hypothetical protein
MPQLTLPRGISWGLGRTSMASLTVLPAAKGSDHVSSTQYFTKMLELYEISNYTMLSQSPAGSSLDTLGLPRCQNLGYFDSVVQLDSCLDKWDKRVPEALRLGSQGNSDETSYRQAFLLRLRYVEKFSLKSIVHTVVI